MSCRDAAREERKENENFEICKLIIIKEDLCNFQAERGSRPLNAPLLGRENKGNKRKDRRDGGD